MLPKSGKNPHILSSYRPISVLSILNKVFKKLLHKKLMELIPYDSLPDHQFGFRPQHSTTDQLQRVASTIILRLKKKQYCSSAVLDVMQALIEYSMLG